MAEEIKEKERRVKRPRSPDNFHDSDRLSKRVRFSDELETNVIEKEKKETEGGAIRLGERLEASRLSLLTDDEAHHLAVQARKNKRLRQAELQGVQLDKYDRLLDDEEEEDLDIAELGEKDTVHYNPDEWDHGYKLEPFNLKKELRSGVFDQIGTRRKFDSTGDSDEDDDDDGGSGVSSADDEEEAEGFRGRYRGEPDPWLQQVRELGEKAYANVPSRRRNENTKEKEKEKEPPLSKDQAIAQLIEILLPGETSLKATNRLKKDLKQKPELKATFDKVIDLTSLLLMNHGLLDVHSLTREQLLELKAS